MKRIVLLCAVLLASCAPAITIDPSTVFVLKIADQTIKADNKVFSYQTAEYRLGLSLTQKLIQFSMVNLSDQPIKIIWDESSLVDTAGIGHRIVSGRVRVIADSLAQVPTFVAPNASVNDGFYPPDSVKVYGLGAVLDDLFPLPLTATTTIRVSLALEVKGQRQRLEVAFFGQP